MHNKQRFITIVVFLHAAFFSQVNYCEPYSLTGSGQSRPSRQNQRCPKPKGPIYDQLNRQRNLPGYQESSATLQAVYERGLAE